MKGPVAAPPWFRLFFPPPKERVLLSIPVGWVRLSQKRFCPMDLVHRQILRILHLVPTSLGYGSVDLHEIVPSRPLDIATPALSEIGFL